MTTFDDRERAFEAKFVLDDEVAFRVAARANRMLGDWAAAKLDLTGDEAEAYASAVVHADFEEAGHEDVIRKVTGDLQAAGLTDDDAEVRHMLFEKTEEARVHYAGGA